MASNPTLNSAFSKAKSDPKTDDCDEIYSIPGMAEIWHVPHDMVLRSVDAQSKREPEILFVIVRIVAHGITSKCDAKKR